MTLKQFIKQNRQDIDHHIRSEWGDGSKKNDEDRREWVLNDEKLYLWAKAFGVKI